MLPSRTRLRTIPSKDGQISASILKHNFSTKTLRSLSLVFYILFSGTSHSTRKHPMQKQYNATYKRHTKIDAKNAIRKRKSFRASSSKNCCHLNMTRLSTATKEEFFTTQKNQFLLEFCFFLITKTARSRFG